MARFSFVQAAEKSPPAALRRKPRQSAYVHVRLIPHLLRALHPGIFEQPIQNRFFGKLL